MPGDCCSVDYDVHFDADEARRDLLAYRENGAEGTTRRLIEVLVAEGIDGASLLDIGGGVGVVQLELLKAGLATSMDVDASRPFLQAAEAEAEELASRIAPPIATATSWRWPRRWRRQTW